VPSGSIVELTATMQGIWKRDGKLSIEKFTNLKRLTPYQGWKGFIL